jgi:hypothetical protein
MTNFINLLNNYIAINILDVNGDTYDIRYYNNILHLNDSRYPKKFIIEYIVNLKILRIWFTKKGFYHGLFFHIYKYIKHWKQFAKKKRFKRLTLKLLKATAEHLGNPRFIDFNEF